MTRSRVATGSGHFPDELSSLSMTMTAATRTTTTATAMTGCRFFPSDSRLLALMKTFLAVSRKERKPTTGEIVEKFWKRLAHSACKTFVVSEKSRALGFQSISSPFVLIIVLKFT